jgi:DHA2 family multidrug resistance protein
VAAPGTNQEDVQPYRWLILIGLILSAVMEVLDTTIVNVSLPQMAGNLGATSEEIGWVSTGYILSNVVVLPLTAWLASRFGRKNYLGASILLFVIASFFCGTSASLGGLVFWRIVQGAGGAALLSTAQATLREIFPREQQGLVQSIYVLGIIVAPTLGPTVGGWITDNYSWHWNFLINLPIGLIAFYLVYNFLQDSKFTMKVGKVDWLGIGLLATGLASLQYFLEEGNAKAWFDSAVIVWTAVTAAVCLPIFVWWELHPGNEMPVVNLRVMKNRDLSAGLILFIALGFGLYGGVFIFPMFAQNVIHLSPTETGLILLPGGIATGASAIFCGRMFGGSKSPIDPRIVIVTGLSLFTYAMFALSTLPASAGANDAQTALLFRGTGLGLLFVPINLAAFSSLKGAEIAQGSSLINLCRQLGGTLGIAALGSFVTNRVAISRTALVNDLYQGNPALQQRLDLASHLFISKGYSAPAAQQAAYGLVDRAVQLQSATLAYNTSFMLIAFVTILTAPAILVLRRPKAAPAGAIEAH